MRRRKSNNYLLQFSGYNLMYWALSTSKYTIWNNNPARIS